WGPPRLRQADPRREHLAEARRARPVEPAAHGQRDEEARRRPARPLPGEGPEARPAIPASSLDEGEGEERRPASARHHPPERRPRHPQARGGAAGGVTGQPLERRLTRRAYRRPAPPSEPQSLRRPEAVPSSSV